MVLRRTSHMQDQHMDRTVDSGDGFMNDGWAPCFKGYRLFIDMPSVARRL
jgi:hypothetical protein